MTPEQLREAAKVMEAAADGKPIQFKDLCSKKWRDLKINLGDYFVFNEPDRYRIKPEPQKVKVRLFRDPNDNQICSIDEKFWKYHSSWIPVSDIIEIEVKDE